MFLCTAMKGPQAKLNFVYSILNQPTENKSVQRL